MDTIKLLLNFFFFFFYSFDEICVLFVMTVALARVQNIKYRVENLMFIRLSAIPRGRENYRPREGGVTSSKRRLMRHRPPLSSYSGFDPGSTTVTIVVTMATAASRSFHSTICHCLHTACDICVSFILQFQEAFKEKLT